MSSAIASFGAGLFHARPRRMGSAPRIADRARDGHRADHWANACEPPGKQARAPRLDGKLAGAVAVVWLFGLAGPKASAGAADAGIPDGITYTNHVVPSVPWSVHVVRWARTNATFEWHSVHAWQAAAGLSTLSAQLEALDPNRGVPVTAVIGDYYRWSRACPGDPRGLQIIGLEVISAPAGDASFWIDPLGQPQCGNVSSRFKVVWPDGTESPFGLNEERSATNLVLYTPAVGLSTRTSGGRDLILEAEGTGPWLPLRTGMTYAGRVREIREGGNAPLTGGTMVLSVGPRARPLPGVQPGAIVRLATASDPDLTGAATAISGGPVLLRRGRVQKLEAAGVEAESYQASTMFERHPRTAVGWNRSEFFLVTVDGRQKALSVGMTLKELAAYLGKLGCEEAMNFDGGGSATLWCGGKVRNSPGDGRERVIANALVLLRKPTLPSSGTQTNEAAR